VNTVRDHAPQKRRPPAHKHLRDLDYPSDLRRLLPAVRISRPRRSSARIHDSAVRPDGAQGEGIDRLLRDKRERSHQ